MKILFFVVLTQTYIISTQGLVLPLSWTPCHQRFHAGVSIEHRSRPSQMMPLSLSSTPNESVQDDTDDGRKISRGKRARQSISRGAQFIKQKVTGTKGAETKSVNSNSKNNGDGMLKKSLAPALITLIIGYGCASRVRKVVSKTSGKVIPRQPFLLQVALLGFVGLEIWRTIPSWMKKQLPLVGEKSTLTGDSLVDDSTDLSSIPVLMKRLQTLLKVGSDKLSSPLSNGEVQASFLALLRLNAQLKAQNPYVRDTAYNESGTVLTAEERAQYADLEEVFELADIAYNELPFDQDVRDALAGRSYSLVRHEPLTIPGSAAHYVAMSNDEKVIVIGVKGTSNLEDFLTDACGNVVNHTLPAPFIEAGPSEIRCHEGVYLATSRLYDDIVRLVEEFFIPTGYKIVITGHSLGGGVACLLAIMLRSQFPELQAEGRVKVVAIAPPPVLDLASSLACKPFTTTVINNADIIPRISLSNLIITMKFLALVDENLEKSGIKPEGLNTTAAFLKTFIEGTDGTMVMSPQEIKKGWEDSIESVGLDDPDHLFVPGKVLHMYDLWSNSEYGLTKNSTVPDPLDGLDVAPLVTPCERVLMTDGTSLVLRAIEIDGRMLSDHLAPTYRSSIRKVFGGQT